MPEKVSFGKGILSKKSGAKIKSSSALSDADILAKTNKIIATIKRSAKGFCNNNFSDLNFIVKHNSKTDQQIIIANSGDNYMIVGGVKTKKEANKIIKGVEEKLR